MVGQLPTGEDEHALEVNAALGESVGERALAQTKGLAHSPLDEISVGGPAEGFLGSDEAHPDGRLSLNRRYQPIDQPNREGLDALPPFEKLRDGLAGLQALALAEGGAGKFHERKVCIPERIGVLPQIVEAK